MLLRTCSCPIPNSWVSLSKEAAFVEPNSVSPIRRTRSMVSLISVSGSSNKNSDSVGFPVKKMSRAGSETDLRELPGATGRPFSLGRNRERKLEERAVAAESAELNSLAPGRILSSSGLTAVAEGPEASFCAELETASQTCYSGNGSGSGNGGGLGGRGGGSDDDGEAGFSGRERLEFYYKRMIKTYPGNSLLLCNYAKFLKVQGDLVKAEDYFARSILENPTDGEVLSLYGDLIWQTHKDAKRAETYFDQAVRAAPENCYVMASYANFLWNAGVDAKDEDGGDQIASVIIGAASHQPPPPLAAAS